MALPARAHTLQARVRSGRHHTGPGHTEVTHWLRLVTLSPSFTWLSLRLAIRRRPPVRSYGSSATRLTINLVCGHSAGSGHARHAPAVGRAGRCDLEIGWSGGWHSTCGAWTRPSSQRTWVRMIGFKICLSSLSPCESNVKGYKAKSGAGYPIYPPHGGRVRIQRADHLIMYQLLAKLTVGASTYEPFASDLGDGGGERG